MSALRLALRRLRRRPLTTALAALLTGATLAVAGLLGTGLGALRGLDEGLTEANRLEAWLARDLSSNDVEALIARVQALPGVGNVRHVPAATLLAEVRETLADTPELISGLDPSWFLQTLEVEVLGDPHTLSLRLRDLPGVAMLLGPTLDRGPLARLLALRRVAATAGASLLVLMALAAASLIAGVAGLQALHDRDETDLMRLFGATEAHVRAPLVAEGALLGTVGSLLAAAAVLATVAAARDALGSGAAGIAGLPVDLPTPWAWTLLLVAGPLLGALGAAFGAGPASWTTRQ